MQSLVSRLQRARQAHAVTTLLSFARFKGKDATPAVLALFPGPWC